MGRPVVVFLASQFPADVYDGEHLLMYMIWKLNDIVQSPYIFTWVCTQATANNHPSIQFIRDFYRLISIKYDNQLVNMFVIHPNLVFKAAFGAGYAFMSGHLWNSTVYIESLHELGRYLEVEKVDLPGFVASYDGVRSQMGLLQQLFE